MRLRIYKNEYGYSTMCPNGDTKIYMPVVFKKGNEPTGNDIIVKDAFFSNYTDKNGLTKPKFVVMSYDIIKLPQGTNVEFGTDLPF